jgi:hypothetical protein
MKKSERLVVKLDRGTVKRITFELLYPNGQLKQVQIENNSGQDWGEISLIVFDGHAIESLLSQSEKSAELTNLWNSLDEKDGLYPPAMLVVNTEGEIQPFCGRHKQLTPPE